MPNHFPPGPSDPRRGFLQTGAAPLDELLRSSGVPKGGAVYLNYQGDHNPAPFLFALATAALNRSERVVFIYAPAVDHFIGDEEYGAALRSGQALASDFEEALKTFDLAPFFNADNPGDPAAPLRYLVANTFSQFLDLVDALLDKPASAPDHVFVWGLEQLFQNVQLYHWMDPAGDDVQLVQEQTDRLRRFLEEVAPRLGNAGTALWLAHSEGRSRGIGTLFTRGLPPLLYARCGHTLLVEDTATECGCGHCPWDKPGVHGVPVALYEHDVLRGEEFVVVLEGEDGFDGPFLDSESDLPAFLNALN